MSIEPRNPEETDDEWNRRTAEELTRAADDKVESDPPENAQANLANDMSGSGEMGTRSWAKPWTWTVWRKRFKT